MSREINDILVENAGQIHYDFVVENVREIRNMGVESHSREWCDKLVDRLLAKNLITANEKAHLMNIHDAIMSSEDVDSVRQNILNVKNDIESDDSIVSKIPSAAANVALSSADAYKDLGGQQPCGPVLANDFMGFLGGIAITWNIWGGIICGGIASFLTWI